MLILIVGITGNIGGLLLDALIQRGHSVRGLARNSEKLSPTRLASLESFHTSKSWYDEPVIRKAMQGVDTVVCAYGPNPVLSLEGQLILVRIMEELGIKRFFTSTWNLDWTNNKFGELPYYDLFLAFARQLAMSSTVEPFYILVGIFTECFFSLPGHGQFAPQHNGVWDPEQKRAVVWGTGDEKWPLTTERDSAEFTAELISDPTKPGGYYKFCSGRYSIKEIAQEYELAKGVKVQLEYKGDIAELERITMKAKSEYPMNKYYEWMGLPYQLCTLNGTYHMKELSNDLYPKVKTTTLQEFFKSDPRL